MKLYGLKNCDSCRKAMKSLPHAEFVDVRAEGVSADQLAAAYSALGDALLNTRSTTWRNLDEADRALPALELLAKEPTVMKRPLIVHGDTFHVGWSAKTQADLGL